MAIALEYLLDFILATLAIFPFPLRFWFLKIFVVLLREIARQENRTKLREDNSDFPIITFTLCFPYRTESVAEKMLTNWFTFLLYKFLKVSMAHLVNHIGMLLGERSVVLANYFSVWGGQFATPNTAWDSESLRVGLLCIWTL